MDSDDYAPIIYKLPRLNRNILDNAVDIQYRDSMPYPKFINGFHHFIHQSKDKCSITEQFANKKKVYYVLSKFEKNIDNYDGDLDGLSRKYFGNKVICRAFFKLWEMLVTFPLVDLDKPNIVTAHLAEAPCSFTQATLLFREKFGKKGVSKGDKYNIITLHPDNEDIIPCDEKFVKSDKRINLFKTFPKKSGKIDGDLTNMKTINEFTNSVKNVDFVTADGGFRWKNENLQEQEAFRLIIGEILTALRILKKGGNFVLKIYESYTDVTIKLLTLLNKNFKEVYITKPFTSRKSNSERYVVCLNYSGFDKKIDALKSALGGDQFIFDVFPDYEIEPGFRTMVTVANIRIANRQFQNINEMVDFINKENYRGDEYQQRRRDQIDATKFWENRFFPTKDFAKYRKELQESTFSD